MAFNLQDAVFQRLKKDKIPVIIYLLTGFQVRGTIKGFDSFTVLVEMQDGGLQLVFKHAVSSVNLGKSVSDPASFFTALQKKRIAPRDDSEDAASAESAEEPEA